MPLIGMAVAQEVELQLVELVVGCSSPPSLVSLGKILNIKLCPVEYECIVIETHTAFACLNELCCTKCMSRKALY